MGRHSRFDPRLNHRGVALVTVLLVMLVLTILTTGVVVIAMNNYNQSSTTVDHNQAYYVAEAGVNYQVKMFEATIAANAGGTSAQISSAIDTWRSGSPFASVTLSTVGGVARTYATTISRSGNNITIASTGTVGTVSRTLSKQIQLSGLIINKAILTNDQLNVNKTDVFLDASGNYGPIQSLSNADGSVSIDKLGKVSEVTIPTPTPPKTFVDVINGCTAVGPISNMTCQTGSYQYKVVYDDSIAALPTIVVPPTPTINKTTDLLAQYKAQTRSAWLVDNKTGAIVINANTATSTAYTLATSNTPKTTFYVPSITISGTVTNFAIDIGNNNIVLVADSLNLSGSFKINGTGTLTIFVPVGGFSYTCGNGSICGVMGNTNAVVSDQFKVIIKGKTGQTLDLSNNTGDFYMSLLTNLNVNLSMKGNGSFNGFLATAGTSISFSGTSTSNMLLYAPNAMMDIQGNASITGAIISKSYENLNSNSTDITFNPLFTTPPFDFLNPYTNPTFNPTLEN